MPEKPNNSLTEKDLSEALSAGRYAISKASSLEDLKIVRIAHLGDKSPLALANRKLGSLSVDQRSHFGAIIGNYRSDLLGLLTQKQELLTLERTQTIISNEKVDVTIAAVSRKGGGVHPLNSTINTIVNIFISMGYSVEEGPEVEAEWLNFDALNIPQNHPARSMQDTFYIDNAQSGIVLRTQTSPVQVRALLNRSLPIYVISPGKVFRSDELDQTHTPVFHQVEGLVVDKGIGMPHLRATIDHFAKQMFGAEVQTRLRPSYFPFTEPSAEMDVFFQGKWVEWGGCGVVNPKVLEVAGIDSSIYSGFAFGMGIERTLMFRNGVPDMRDMVEGDIRFTDMFGKLE